MRSQLQHLNRQESWLKRLFLFPFRLAGFLVRSIVGIGIVLILLILVYSGVRSLMPMTLPEAQGMRYVDFLGERVEAIRAISDDSDACYRSAFLLLPFYVLRTSGIPALIAVYDPGGPTDRWLQQHDPNYSFLLPRSEPTYWRILPLYWEAVERASWVFLVRGVESARNCATVTTVNFTFSIRN